jgi:hypothetical protein
MNHIDGFIAYHDGVLASRHADRMPMELFEGTVWRETQCGGQRHSQWVLRINFIQKQTKT